MPYYPFNPEMQGITTAELPEKGVICKQNFPITDESNPAEGLSYLVEIDKEMLFKKFPILKTDDPIKNVEVIINIAHCISRMSVWEYGSSIKKD